MNLQHVTYFIALVIMLLLSINAQSIESSNQQKYNCTNINKNVYQFLYKGEIIDNSAEKFNVELDKKISRKEDIKKILKY